jgi:hypothetical protein
MILSPKTIGEGVFRCTWPVLGYAEHSLNVFGNDLEASSFKSKRSPKSSPF